MGWLFRRRASGRHGLGAAVTSIPSGPLVLPVSVPVVDPVVAAALARAQAEASLLPALPLDEVERLLGTVPPAPVVVPAPVEAAQRVDPAVLPPEPGPGPCRTGFLETVFSREEAVDDGSRAPFVPAQLVGTARVQLGFRDGSTRTVDDVDQAAALEELARALTSSG